MANFIIKPKDEDHLKLQNDAGTDIIEIKDDDAVLYVSRDDDAEVAIESYNDDETKTPKLTMRKADNVAASPQTVVNNDVLGTISFQGHDGTNFEEGARIEARVDGSPADSGTDMPTELTFWTTKDGSAPAVEQMVLSRQGNLTVRGGFAHSLLTASLINGY